MLFDTNEDLLEYVQGQIEDTILEDVVPAGEDILGYSIIKNVYYAYEPIVYERTDTLLESVDADVMSTPNSAEVSFFNNPMKMSYRYPSTSARYAQDNRENIAEWINYGHTLWGVDYYPATLYMESAAEELDRKIAGIVTRGLRARGLIVK